MSTSGQGSNGSNGSSGKERLTAAALRLCATGRSVHSLGLRELARESGLNPNTFYRHFSSMDDLGAEVGNQVATQIIEGSRRARRRGKTPAEAGTAVIDFYFTFVAKHPDVLAVALQERYAGTPAMREMVRSVLDQIVRDNVAQMTAMGLDHSIEPDRFYALGHAITLHNFDRTRDYLDASSAKERRTIVDECRWFARTLTLGALTAGRQLS